MTATIKKRIQNFTIVEILVAMSVFAILMLIIMQIFGSLQTVWTTTSKRTQTSQNANVIMNMIATDLQSAYYNKDADKNTSWCYYQTAQNMEGPSPKPLWFITSRQKSAQTAGSSLVQTGYYLEKNEKDGVTLYALKNLTISNIAYKDASSDLYNFRTESAPAGGLLGSSVTALNKNAVLIDDNIVSLTIIPHVKKTNPTSGNITFDKPDACTQLPTYVEIKLEMLDDDPSVRAAYKEANSDDQKRMIRTYTRVIEINRGQYYE